jgi:tetratricopeptide (TPR) repeat protein
LAGFSVVLAATAPLAGETKKTDADKEREIAAPLVEKDPAAAELFARANDAHDRGDLATAADLYGKVREADPWFVAATRRLCGVEAQQDHREVAIPLCREAVAKEGNAFDYATLAEALLVASPGAEGRAADINEAVGAARKAISLDPEDRSGYHALCICAMAKDDEPMLHEGALGLIRVAPDDIPTNMFASMDSASLGDFDTAERFLDKAHREGLPDAQWQAKAARRRRAPA